MCLSSSVKFNLIFRKLPHRLHVSTFISVVRASNQSIIDRQGILMQISHVVGLKIVLFRSKHTVTNFILVPRTDLYEFALSLSCGPFTGDAAKEFTTNDSGNRNSLQSPTVQGPLHK